MKEQPADPARGASGSQRGDELWQQLDKRSRVCDIASLDPPGSDGPDRMDRWMQRLLPGWLIAPQETSFTNRQGWLDLEHPLGPEGVCPAGAFPPPNRSHAHCTASPASSHSVSTPPSPAAQRRWKWVGSPRKAPSQPEPKQVSRSPGPQSHILLSLRGAQMRIHHRCAACKS